MVRDKKIQNALKRSEVHRKTKREKEQVKLKRRMEVSRPLLSVETRPQYDL
jgi:ribosome production factor 1